MTKWTVNEKKITNFYLPLNKELSRFLPFYQFKKSYKNGRLSDIGFKFFNYAYHVCS